MSQSPLPWKVSPAFNVVAANGDVVALVSALSAMWDNAEFIVRCVNSHVDLLAALKKCYCLDCGWQHGEHMRGRDEFAALPPCPSCAPARAAIAKAEQP